MGGLARRVSYEKLFKERVGGIPALVVDSGNSFASETNAHGALRPDVQVKDDWILNSYEDFKVDVINVAAPDLRYVGPLLTKREQVVRGGAQDRKSTRLNSSH